MISVLVVALIMWIIAGLLGLINCLKGNECRWIDYWIVYGVLIAILVNQIVEKLA